VLIKLYDYVDARGVNQIAAWTRSLEATERAKLAAKLLILEKLPVESLPQYLKGPRIQGEKEIYKLQIGASGSRLALRPLACRGPFDKDTEITLLVGAVERDNQLAAGAGALAERRRKEIIADPKRRTTHERIERTDRQPSS
jgi:hypothetical protein